MFLEYNKCNMLKNVKHLDPSSHVFLCSLTYLRFQASKGAQKCFKNIKKSGPYNWPYNSFVWGTDWNTCHYSHYSVWLVNKPFRLVLWTGSTVSKRSENFKSVLTQNVWQTTLNWTNYIEFLVILQLESPSIPFIILQRVTRDCFRIYCFELYGRNKRMPVRKSHLPHLWHSWCFLSCWKLTVPVHMHFYYTEKSTQVFFRNSLSVLHKLNIIIQIWK